MLMSAPVDKDYMKCLVPERAMVPKSLIMSALVTDKEVGFRVQHRLISQQLVANLVQSIRGWRQVSQAKTKRVRRAGRSVTSAEAPSPGPWQKLHRKGDRGKPRDSNPRAAKGRRERGEGSEG
uniref:Uncharacterized protein n=1 Tax=Eutreptiella gymnastica TaxID=73025 RepID=A0A7S1NG99_9EUGL